jgi:EAL domain-containing protein (putative c-di-GMP-specific phosphodiesterase class I)
VQAPRQWKKVWDGIYGALKRMDALNSVELFITPGAEWSLANAKTAVEMQQLAESLWLGDALLAGRIMCYLQPVMSGADAIFGYESFARVQDTDGSIIAGDRIVAASRVLGIQHMIDRHLHVQAIKTFVASDFDGFLFVNFFPGFIHRPEVYLEGLTETVANYGVTPGHIVLDFTRMETPRDLQHIKSICDYGRSRGYSIAIDDIVSVENTRRLVAEIHPDFVKVDTLRLQKMGGDALGKTVAAIVEVAHAAKATVIAEGVETAERFAELKQLGVDLFQGYYFSPPVPAPAALRQKKA